MPLRTLTVSGKLKPVSFIIPCICKQVSCQSWWLLLHSTVTRWLSTCIISVLMLFQGRLTLLMGPPRSGKSLFMQMLAGEANCLLCSSCVHRHALPLMSTLGLAAPLMASPLECLASARGCGSSRAACTRSRWQRSTLTAEHTRF